MNKPFDKDRKSDLKQAGNTNFPVKLTVAAYDRVAAMLVALLIVVGFLVLIMFLIWLTNRVFAKQIAVPVEFLEELSGRGDHALGSARDLEEPGVEELEEDLEPQLENTLLAIMEVVSTQQAKLDEFEADSPIVGKGWGEGDSRPPGLEGDGNVIPRWQRWEIHFATTSLLNYKKQLDYFGVELSAVGGEQSKVDYLSKLSLSRPIRRSGSSDAENRLYMTWRSGGLQQVDREILNGAGISTAGRIILQFYSAKIEQDLARLEKQYMGNRDLRTIRKTFFGVKTVGRGYEFYVIDQVYRSLP